MYNAQCYNPPMRAKPISFQERATFLNLVDLSGKECWRWKGPVDDLGRGVWARGDVSESAHHASFRMFRKHDFDPEKSVDQNCGNRLCMRASHLVQAASS